MLQPYETRLVEEYDATMNGNLVSVKVEMKWYPDEMGDQGDYLGEFSDKYSDYAVDRRWELLGIDVPEAKEYQDEDGEWVEEDEPEPPYHLDRNEHTYFHPSIGFGKGDDLDEYRKYALQDYERVMSLYRGDWGYIGIMAEAVVTRKENDYTRWFLETSSGGLWGIESDSGQDYFDEVEESELADLQVQLDLMGIARVEEADERTNS